VDDHFENENASVAPSVAASRFITERIAAMKYLTIAPSILAIVLVGVLSTPAQADECNELTYLTFSAPVALPGVTLSAGTYRFSRLGCVSSSDVVRVSSADGKQQYGLFNTIPATRLTPRSRPEVVFAEMPAGSAEAITAWFYPGSLSGEAFLYPTNEAAMVAQAKTQKVFASPETRRG
jgi:hypothetical protein